MYKVLMIFILSCFLLSSDDFPNLSDKEFFEEPSICQKNFNDCLDECESKNIQSSFSSCLSNCSSLFEECIENESIENCRKLYKTCSVECEVVSIKIEEEECSFQCEKSYDFCISQTN